MQRYMVCYEDGSITYRKFASDYTSIQKLRYESNSIECVYRFKELENVDTNSDTEMYTVLIQIFI